MNKLYTVVYDCGSGDGHLIPITNLFDAEGNNTTNVDEAWYFVAELPDGNWLSASTSEYTIRKMH